MKQQSSHKFKVFMDSLYNLEKQRIALLQTAVQLGEYFHEQHRQLHSCLLGAKRNLERTETNINSHTSCEERFHQYATSNAHREIYEYYEHPRILWVLGIFLFIFLEFIFFFAKWSAEEDLNYWSNLFLPLLIALGLILLPHFGSVVICRVRYLMRLAKEKADYPHYCQREQQFLAEQKQLLIDLHNRINTLEEERQRLDNFFRLEMKSLQESVALLEAKIEQLYKSFPTFPKKYKFDFKQLDELKRFFDKVGYDSIASEMFTNTGYDDNNTQRIIHRAQFFKQIEESSEKIQDLEELFHSLQADTLLALQELENQYSTELRMLETQCRTSNAEITEKIDRKAVGYYRDTLAICLVADQRMKQL